MGLSVFISIMMALCGLAAGWSKCVHEKPNTSGFLHRIPGIGPYLSRMRWKAWFFGIAIVVLTAINVMLSDRAQNQLDERLGELRKATLDIQTVSHDQQKSLGDSIDRLGTLKTEVDGVAKQASNLNQIANDTAKSLREGTASLKVGNDTILEAQKAVSEMQAKLAESLRKGNTDVLEVQNNLATTLRDITKQMDIQSKALLDKQVEFISRLDASADKSEKLRTMLTGYISDELTAQSNIHDIETSRKMMDLMLDNMKNSLKDHMTNNEFGWQVTLLKWMLSSYSPQLETPEFVNLVTPSINRLNEFARTLPKDEYSASTVNKNALQFQVMLLKLDFDCQCDTAVMAIHSRRLRKLQGLPPLPPLPKFKLETSAPKATTQPGH